jgi:hypothetical protein
MAAGAIACGPGQAASRPASDSAAGTPGAMSAARDGALTVALLLNNPELDAIRARVVQTFGERYPRVGVEVLYAPSAEYNQSCSPCWPRARLQTLSLAFRSNL